MRILRTGATVAAMLAGALACSAEAGAQAPARPADPRAAAAADTALRVIVSLGARRVWVVSGTSDTLFTAPAAVGSGRTLRTATQAWTFATPPGVHVVRSKEVNPVWVRPDWSYIEAARKNGLRTARLEPDKSVAVGEGRWLVVRNRVAGLVDESDAFSALPIREDLVFGGVLYIPPVDAENRRVPGELGRYRLNLGGALGLHGTPDTASIGRAVTHGCVRLRDGDIEWLYLNVPVATRVYVIAP